MEADEVSDDHIALTKAVRARLRAEHRRTDVTAMQLLDGSADLPVGLTAGSVNRWINGLIRSAPRYHLDYVFARWAALPGNLNVTADGAPVRKRGKRYPTASGMWIEVTEAMSSQLRAELARTGVDHARLLDSIADVPSDLNARVIKGWLYREAETTRAAHWDYVVARLGTMPDFAAALPPLKRKRPGKLNIT